MKKIIIAAVSKNGCIGKNGKLPWHNESEMVHFKQTTLGYPIIMGRKTFDSLPWPLPRRANIVVSRSGVSQEIRSKSYKRVGQSNGPTFMSFTSSVEEAFQDAENTKMRSDKCFIIGGEQIYRLCMDMADEMIISHMDVNVESGDTFFPEWPITTWTECDCVNYHDFAVKKYIKN